jgi:hypothetical protein
MEALMTDWPTAGGVLPPRPDEAFNPSMQYARRPPTQANEVRRSRADVLAQRELERSGGHLFWLDQTKMHARVRDLEFTDRVMLMGIPEDMRDVIAEAIIQTRQARESGRPNIVNALSMAEGQAALIDGICIAGFIWPRLVRTDLERQRLIAQGMDEEDVYLVGDLHDDEKEAYKDFIFRNRGFNQEDVARVASFPGARPQEAGVRIAGEGVLDPAV